MDSPDSTATDRATTARERRRVALATTIGTTIEWYDFFIYASAAGLVFAQLYFRPAGDQIALLLSFGSVGVSFLFRPLGAFLAGHLGDLIGRKAMLVLTLILMGAATTLIGVLPTYDSAGVLAPVCLLILRILQGLSAGGEWGGAILMAVEHAPEGRRGRFGAFPQLGPPLGLLAASGMFALMAVIAPGEAFAAWGWRVPFLFSVVLIAVGLIVRTRVAESPVFTELAQRRQRTTVPIARLFRFHTPIVILAALTFAGNNAAGYMTTGGYIQNYATNPAGPLGLERAPVLLAVTASAVVWGLSTWIGGTLSDRIGRRTTYLIGWGCQLLTVFPMFWLVNTGDLWLLGLGLALFTIGNGLTYGPQAAFFAELFPASIRYSGVAISYAIGAILGGAFAPTIATALVQQFGSTNAVAVYLAVLTVIAAAATFLLRDRTGIPLGPEHEQAQSRGTTILSS
ncbi:MFS transporter [Microlunatus speluncae]|uniref:MFS transporter n=1 Tax=Microlunatus speluncae TaxID=2594267 RepID=UPI0012666941|nr:MFS transporter [Microlunatus speluncae]